MKWEKKGLIYCPDGSMSWARNSALTPTPVLVNESTIRVYAGLRDDKGVSRIGYVDVRADDPSRIKAISPVPVLDVGIPGTFDDNGVILGDIVFHDNIMYMYYVGFQLVEKVKFLAFTGLATSTDGGSSFRRYSNAPVLDRSNTELYFRAVHSAMIEDGVWKVWCGVGSDWVYINGIPYPKYDVRYYESPDGINFSEKGIVCIENTENEYRIGRPRVINRDGNYKMFYTKGTLGREYLPGYADSKDGVHWVRKDTDIGIKPSGDGWDSTQLCYPAIISFEDRIYMFYNGNDYGKTGFGYAELIEW
jgi:predicted GH43/DUF377 family glycosyl hydrolase